MKMVDTYLDVVGGIPLKTSNENDDANNFSLWRITVKFGNIAVKCWK